MCNLNFFGTSFLGDRFGRESKCPFALCPIPLLLGDTQVARAQVTILWPWANFEMEAMLGGRRSGEAGRAGAPGNVELPLQRQTAPFWMFFGFSMLLFSFYEWMDFPFWKQFGVYRKIEQRVQCSHICPPPPPQFPLQLTSCTNGIHLLQWMRWYWYIIMI